MELPIIYGSQTGNAAFLSELVRKSFLFGYNDFSLYNECSICSDKCVYTCEADRIDIKYLLNCKYIIFLTSTHGDGDEPFNSKNLWNFLRFKGLPANLLANLKFAVYGLGDSSYDKFNFYAKKLCNRLKALGAQEILARADGDIQDKEGYMTTFKPWLKLIHEYFADMEFKSAKHIPLCTIAQPTFRALVTDTKYVTPKDYKHAILRLELKIDDYKEFKHGDAIRIRPKNYNYKEFITYNKDSLTSDDRTTEIEDQYVSWATIEELLESHYDFNSIPHQIIFLHLHNEISSNENLTKNVDISRVQIIQKLMEIYTIYDVYYDYIVKPKRTFFEVLQELKITITFSFIEKYIPKILPRYFSTAYVNDRYHVNVSLVNYKTKISKNRKGLCSEYLRLIEINTEMEVTIVKGNLDFNSENLLFICTGTGITLPFSAMQYYKDKNMLLFYGFRDSTIDQLYVDEMQGITDNKISIVTAPSCQGSRLYVQDVFKQYKDLDISKYKIIISGNTRLTKIFRAVFKDLYPDKQILFQSEPW